MSGANSIGKAYATVNTGDHTRRDSTHEESVLPILRWQLLWSIQAFLSTSLSAAFNRRDNNAFGYTFVSGLGSAG